MSWYKLQSENIFKSEGIQTQISLSFGTFWKCGFYDWRLVSLDSDGKMVPLEVIGDAAKDQYDQEQEYYDEIGCLAQGRFILHPKGFRD